MTMIRDGKIVRSLSRRRSTHSIRVGDEYLGIRLVALAAFTSGGRSRGRGRLFRGHLDPVRLRGFTMQCHTLAEQDVRDAGTYTSRALGTAAPASLRNPDRAGGRESVAARSTRTAPARHAAAQIRELDPKAGGDLFRIPSPHAEQIATQHANKRLADECA